jgi:hypothetical protein
LATGLRQFATFPYIVRQTLRLTFAEEKKGVSFFDSAGDLQLFIHEARASVLVGRG